MLVMKLLRMSACALAQTNNKKTMKYLIITILLLTATPVLARTSALTNQVYDLKIEAGRTEVVIPNFMGCNIKGTPVPCQIESQELWTDCKNGKDISEIISSMDCSQKTYEEYVDMRVKRIQDATLENEANKLTAEDIAKLKALQDAPLGNAEPKTNYILYVIIGVLSLLLIFKLWKA